MNKVMLIGRLGRDPELRYAANSFPVATLRIATDESYTNRDGKKVERTEWHTVIVFQRQAENCQTYLKKGNLVFVEGSLQTRKWQDQQGQDRYTTEIKASRVQFLDRNNVAASAKPELEDANHVASSHESQSGKAPAVCGGVEDVDAAFGVFPGTASELDKVPW